MLLQKCLPFSTGLLTQLQKKKKRWHVKNHYTFATRLLPPERPVQLQRWFWNSRRRMKKLGRKCRYLIGYTQRWVVIFNDCQFNWNNIYAKFLVLTIDWLIDLWETHDAISLLSWFDHWWKAKEDKQ